MNYFEYKGIRSSDMGLRIESKNVFSAPKYDVDFLEIPGRDGDLIAGNGRFPNVQVTYSVFLPTKTISELSQKITSVKAWLYSGPNSYHTLSDTYDTTFFRHAVYAGKGDALLQKKFTVDFLTKKQKVNEGEVPQYYVEGSHPAIISAMDFDRVQAEIARRQSLGRSYSGSSIFASKLICGDCGGFYGKKVWHSTDAYRREVWRCNGKFSGEAKCGTPTLTTEGIQRMFLQAYNQLMGNREQVIQACEVMRSMVSDCSQLDTEIDVLNEEIAVVAELVSQCIKENATTQQSQEEYNKKYNRLVKRYEKAVDRLNKATAERESRKQRDRDLRIFIGSIKEQPLVLETWDEGLWLTLLDTATVHADNRITFRFKDGTDIEVGAE